MRSLRLSINYSKAKAILRLFYLFFRGVNPSFFILTGIVVNVLALEKFWIAIWLGSDPRWISPRKDPTRATIERYYVLTLLFLRSIKLMSLSLGVGFTLFYSGLVKNSVFSCGSVMCLTDFAGTMFFYFRMVFYCCMNVERKTREVFK